VLDGDFPVGIIQRLEEVFEEILKQLNTTGEFDIDMAIILQDQPGDVGNDEGVLSVAASMLKVAWKGKLNA
jgi:hypothetical protein